MISYGYITRAMDAGKAKCFPLHALGGEKSLDFSLCEFLGIYWV